MPQNPPPKLADLPAPTDAQKVNGKVKVCVAGAGGFIGAHLARRMKNMGKYVVAVDW
jgi:hypothetical protein